MDRKKIRKQIRGAFTIFSPRRIILREHLTKHDVGEVKKKIVSNMSPINMVLASIFMVANIILLVAMNVSTGGKQAEVYGVPALISQIIGLVGSFVIASLIGFSYYSKNETTAIRLRRLGCGLLYLVVLSQMLLSIIADAQKGFTTQTDSLSAGVILIVVLMLVQPAFWSDAIILNTMSVVGIVVTALVCKNMYGMHAFGYYIAVAGALGVGAYIVVCILFYAETQRYCQNLQTEMYHNVALYDELTKCKNRSALKEYIEKRRKSWEGKQINVLLIMFDIDNFKEYNDHFSHLGGDYCLKVITESIRLEFSSPNLEFYRWGGEEFLLFFELKSQLDAIPLLKRVRTAVHNANLEAPEGAPKEIVTVSIGGHFITYRDNFVFNKELAVVDEYLYKAKNAGKDVICYNGDLLIMDDKNDRMNRPERKDKIVA